MPAEPRARFGFDGTLEKNGERYGISRVLNSTRTSRIYGLDILVGVGPERRETNRPGARGTHPSGRASRAGHPSRPGRLGPGLRLVDPTHVEILAVGVSTIDGDEYYDGDERRLLRILDQRFAVLPSGVISTWHGSRLDLPFLRARAQVLGIELGLRLATDDRRPTRLGTSRLGPGRRRRHHDVEESRLDGSAPVCGAWHRQRHLDLCRVYGPHDSGLGTDELVGLDPRRGAHLARSLAERRWFRARRFVDRVPQSRPPTSYTWTCMSPEYSGGPPVSVLPMRRND